MKIINIIGGLGNQIFQYAFYYWLKENGHQVAIDDSYFDAYNLHNGFELTNVFNIKPRIASNSEVNKYKHGYQRSKSFYVALKKKIFALSDLQILSDSAVKWEYRNVAKNQKLISLQNAYLIGYWSRETYLYDFQSKLQNHLQFQCVNNLSSLNKDFLRMIQKNETLAIHLRGGDYSESARLQRNYYLKAIEIVKRDNIVKDILVFTNDKKYASAVLDGLIYQIVDCNIGSDSSIDMYLMSMAKNLIIANSTFSWWGAYLNKSYSSVLYPKGFFEIVPKDWILVD